MCECVIAPLRLNSKRIQPWSKIGRGEKRSPSSPNSPVLESNVSLTFTICIARKYYPPPPLPILLPRSSEFETCLGSASESPSLSPPDDVCGTFGSRSPEARDQHISLLILFRPDKCRGKLLHGFLLYLIEMHECRFKGTSLNLIILTVC